MKTIIKGRWVVFALWLIAAVVLTVFQPDVNAILRDRGQSILGENSPSGVADDLLQKMDGTVGNSDVLVFYDKNKLSDDELSKIDAGVKAFAASSSELGIHSIVDPFTTPEAKSSLVSSDGTTLMVSFQLDKAGREMDGIMSAIDAKLRDVGVEHYLTGEDFIANDYLKASVAGVERSAVLTVIFILVILIFMFRSVVTPIVSLVTVAFSYLTSMGIAAQLIDKAHFPVTTLTQLLLILILFGIGTDYNILLFNRFKEELSRGRSVDDAILHTYKTAGKTIAYSVLTVFIAFLSLIFSESPIYKSGIVVVIGAVMLLLEIMTLTPFVMKLFGGKLFWPSKNTDGHRESRLWGGLTAFSTKRAVVSVILTVLIAGSAALFYQQRLNFDQISELGDAYPASKGFGIVADHFGRGQAMPSTLVLESGGALDNNEALSVLDEITQKLQKIDGVQKVSSATQPQGTAIEGFYVSTQMTSVTDGLAQVQDGLNQISGGFGEAQTKLSSADFSKVGDLVSGTAQLQEAITALSGGLAQMKDGISGGSQSQTLRGGIAAIEGNLSQMSAGIQTISENFSAMQAGYQEMGSHYQAAANALLGVKSALTQIQAMADALGASTPAVKSDPNYLGMKGALDGLLSSLSNVTAEGMAELQANYDKTTAGFGEANVSLAAMGQGLGQVADGLSRIESGLGQTSDGLGTIITNMDQVAQGLGEMKAGQQQLADGLSEFGSFGTQMSQVTDALNTISSGIGKSKAFLMQFGQDKAFHVPDEALASTDFKKALDAYMSGDRKITKLIILLRDDPYSLSAVNTIKEINSTVSDTLKGTALSSARYGISGPSSVTNDMNDVLSRDLNRMILIVLAGVFLVLLLVIRSFWTSVMITLSLVGAYYAAIFVSNTVFIDVLKYAGLSSYVPFFSFIVIVALGVDYSIFFMMRFKEFGRMAPQEAIVKAARQIGGVVLSAVVILGGTFATLIPSGMLILEELAVTVITGLILLSVLMLPVFLPAAIKLLHRFDQADAKEAAQPEKGEQ